MSKFILAWIRRGDLQHLAAPRTGGKLASVTDRRHSLPLLAHTVRYRIAGHARAKIPIPVGARVLVPWGLA